MDSSAFGLFKSEDKYVTAFTANGDSWLLPERIRLKDLASAVPGIMRVSRSVLVAREYVERISGTRDMRRVHALGYQFNLSRDEQPEPFQKAAIENLDRRPIVRWDQGMKELVSSLGIGKFAVVRFEKKQMIGITTECEVWRLPAHLRLSRVLDLSREFLAVNRSVVVARSQVEEVGGDRDNRYVRAFGKDYPLSRMIDPELFRAAVQENRAVQVCSRHKSWNNTGRGVAEASRSSVAIHA